jgi:hypothetical protein
VAKCSAVSPGPANVTTYSSDVKTWGNGTGAGVWSAGGGAVDGLDAAARGARGVATETVGAAGMGLGAVTAQPARTPRPANVTARSRSHGRNPAHGPGPLRSSRTTPSNPSDGGESRLRPAHGFSPGRVMAVPQDLNAGRRDVRDGPEGARSSSMARFSDWSRAGAGMACMRIYLNARRRSPAGVVEQDQGSGPEPVPGRHRCSGVSDSCPRTEAMPARSRPEGDEQDR